jgi:hypothetical protein
MMSCIISSRYTQRDTHKAGPRTECSTMSKLGREGTPHSIKRCTWAFLASCPHPAFDRVLQPLNPAPCTLGSVVMTLNLDVCRRIEVPADSSNFRRRRTRLCCSPGSVIRCAGKTPPLLQFLVVWRVRL